MRKRVGVLVAVFVLVGFTGLAANVAAYYTTPVQSFSWNYLSCGFNGGASSQYSYSGPATDTFPQFYFGAETHNVVCAWANSITIRITGTDPNGHPLTGDRFQSLTALMSPTSGGIQSQVMSAVYNFLLNVLPYGIGSDIQYLQSNPQSGTNYDSTSAWGVWNAPLFSQPADAGLRFGFHLSVDAGLSGSYHIQINYHFTNYHVSGKFQYLSTHDLYDNLVYCFNYCTVNDDFETPGLWASSVSGGSSFVADSLYGYSTQVSQSPTHSVQVGFTGGNTDGTDYGSVLMYRDFATTRVNRIAISYDDSLYSHNGNYWDRLSAGVRMRLYNSAGTNYATYEYWLASWYQGQNCQTPGSNQISISCQPSMNTWHYVNRYPNSDWTISWSGCTKVRIELFASAVGTNADQFQMYFDDFAMA